MFRFMRQLENAENFSMCYMPRSRRRHHSRSRSRSRSRSHSHDRDREPKRRKIDGVDSPTHKRSVSCEPQSPVEKSKKQDVAIGVVEKVETIQEIQEEKLTQKDLENERTSVASAKTPMFEDEAMEEVETAEAIPTQEEKMSETEAEANKMVATTVETADDSKVSKNAIIGTTQKTAPEEVVIADSAITNPVEEPKPVPAKLEEKLVITPKKAMSPKQLQKKLESEKKRQQKQQEREEREKKKQEEKERLRLEKQKQKQEKEEQKQKERESKEEQKRKEREEKEAKRKEKEERDEQKRKEREQEKLRKQQEIEEKNKEKQKLEEQKQKAAAAFVNFFVPKKPEVKVDEVKTSKFMPFQVKSDMRLAPRRRPVLTEEEMRSLEECLEKPDENASYLRELKEGKPVGKCPQTWPYEEDVIVIEEDFGVSIDEDENKTKSKKMKAKFLKFHKNRRPPYFGTWRKKSRVIGPRKPFVEDKSCFDYDVDSDDDWEEEEQGESLSSDDEEKENDAENEEYEVDNDFFVPHGHLSEDEVDEEATSKLSPESHKQKLKLLKDEFDLDMQMKTNKMKPRSIGCIWYNKDGSNVDEVIDRHLRPLAMITNGQIIIKKRRDLVDQTPTRKYAKELREELIPAFLKMIHCNVNRKTLVVDDFINYMQNNGYTVEVSKAYLGKRLKQFAQWRKCTEKGPMLNKFCWCVEDEVKKKYNVGLALK